MLTVDPNNNVEITRGDGEPIKYDIKDSSGNDIDVSGWSWLFTVKKSIDDDIAAAKFQKSTGGGGITVVVGPTPGITSRVLVQLEDVDSALLDGHHVYDLQGYDGARSHTPVAVRAFRVRKDVTTPGSAGQPSFGVVVFPGGMFAVGSDGNWYVRDKVTLLWVGFYYANEMLNQSPVPSPTIPFTF